MAFKNYEDLCQVENSGNDKSDTRAETTKRFYVDLRTAEELFAKAENDVVGVSGIASFRIQSDAKQLGQKDTTRVQQLRDDR